MVVGRSSFLRCTKPLVLRRRRRSGELSKHHKYGAAGSDKMDEERWKEEEERGQMRAT